MANFWIGGAIIAGILFILLLLGLVFFFYWRRRAVEEEREAGDAIGEEAKIVEISLPTLSTLSYTDLESLTLTVIQQMGKLSSATVFPDHLIAPMESYRQAITDEVDRISNFGTAAEQQQLKEFIGVVTNTVAPLEAILRQIKIRNELQQELLRLSDQLQVEEDITKQTTILNQIITTQTQIALRDDEIAFQIKRFFGSNLQE